MDEDIPLPFDLPAVARKKVSAAFDGGRIEAAVMPIDESASYGLVTQTTLSVIDAEEITAILRRRISDLQEPSKSDICYATTNRQRAVTAIAPRCCDRDWRVKFL